MFHAKEIVKNSPDIQVAPSTDFIGLNDVLLLK